MFKKLADFFGRLSVALQWTGLYFAATWLLFAFLFKFDILNAADWARIGTAHLRGPSGVAFGVLTLAALPIYCATVVVIWRNKEMLIESPFKKKKSEDKKADDARPGNDEEKQPDATLPPELPAELRAPYMNLRRGGMARGSYSPTVTLTANPADTIMPAAPAMPAPELESAMPLPDDFNFDAAPAAPMFKDISFGTEKPKVAKATATAPVPDFDAMSKNGTSVPLSQIIEKLSVAGLTCEVDGDIIIAQNLVKHAVATHADPDFWIADGAEWFATGKQKPSPIMALLTAAEKHGASPVLYLAEKNIMNLDTQIKEWQDSGIRIIFDLGEL